MDSTFHYLTWYLLGKRTPEDKVQKQLENFNLNFLKFSYCDLFWFVLFPTCAGSPFFRKSGGPQLREGHHFDAQLSADTK